MQRQRDGLVPIGEALADLDGPVQAIREASSQALHHFTQADQVNQLVSASEADPDLGFMARMMALCSLPRTNQRCCMDRGGDGIRPFPSGSVRRCVRTQAVRVRSLCSEPSG